ncbi:TetR/AcrR family transcriptional regulator [Pseudonocardia endophytica]|uniref:TetR family transcriptional regulator n=1 Tax=Pseudonocardia endophytica TaxID=401976 RepID=A0A4R1HEL0_PSEEN|nr:TetR/AcrR family transcriptional regulator [Pseudonocardia endophytica]TCK20544.1 TetR family transcriptional regulator [Pseudonocardia endophytica]
MSTAVPGRRERKKAATRRALADAALELFLDRGFDGVTVAEIADAADVSVTTLFKHFPSKEALLFDEDGDREADLTGAVTGRADGETVLDALHRWFVGRLVAPPRRLGGRGTPTAEDMERFGELLGSTPSLREYGRRMWARHEDALADAIAAEVGESDPSPAVRAIANIVVHLPALLRRDGVDPREQLDATFALLRDGWAEHG